MTNINPQKKQNQKIYDFAIIGAGLSGLSIATALSRYTSNIVLIDQNDSFGGHNRSIQTSIGLYNNGLRFLPDSDLSRKSIRFLENLLEIDLKVESIENNPKTFEGGSFKNFLGFGDHPPLFYDELSYFISNKRLKTLLEPHEWTQVLFNNFKGEFLARSYVTKFHGENEEIQSLTINGQKHVFANNFIFCGPIKDLQVLLPADGLSSKARQKISKSKFWTAICLDLVHEQPLANDTFLNVLNGTTQDDIGPCVGLFQPETDLETTQVQFSQWLTFVDNEDAEDSELIGHALKKIKRQIKRAYPSALDNLKFERILVAPSIGGNGDLKLNSNQSIQSYKNFWIGSGVVNPSKNILGSLLQAELIVNSLGFNEVAVPQEIIDEGLSSSQEQQILENSL